MSGVDVADVGWLPFPKSCGVDYMSTQKINVIGPIPWGHSGRSPLSRVVVVVVVDVVDIDAQAARDSTAIATSAQ